MIRMVANKRFTTLHVIKAALGLAWYICSVYTFFAVEGVITEDFRYLAGRISNPIRENTVVNTDYQKLGVSISISFGKQVRHES